MQRALAVRRRLRAAQRLAVDRDHLARGDAHRGRPSGEASLQRLRVEKAKHLAQSLRSWDPVRKRQKPAQPVQTARRDLFDTLPVVRPANNPGQRRQQNLVQRIGHHPRDPVVGDNSHMIQKTKRHGVLLPTPFESILVKRPLTI